MKHSFLVSKAIPIVAVLSIWTAGYSLVQGSETRQEVAPVGDGVSPENLTSTKDGTIYFGSTAKGAIYRALPGATHAEPWIQPAQGEPLNVLGVLADEKSKTLWVCANPPFGKSDTPKPPMLLKAYDLRSGKSKGNYPIPGEGAINDIAVDTKGNVFVSDTFASRILRLKKGAKEVDVWLSDPQLRGIDGLTFLADGALYFNNYFNGKLSRVVPASNGSAGAIVDLKTSVPFQRPDGLRASGPNRMLQVEGTGRLAEITISGDLADVRVIKEGLANATGVTQVGSSVFVLVSRSKAVVVPLN